ncbi:hypothetical protein VNI00_018155 [Paramarasmius palmivorus]|uniref:Uncharacterized protein n=1 Tax=Paramarasmius palmivorus TaxID=297713 RepID=A0AAW0AZV3_9AGAR
MPRKKVHKNSQARREAAKQKAQRYYYSQREVILERRKNARKQRQTLEAEAEVCARKERKERHRHHQGELHQKKLRDAELIPSHSGHDRDPEWHMLRIENALMKEKGKHDRLSHYFDGIVLKLLKWDSANPDLRPPVSPLNAPGQVLRTLFKQAEQYTEALSSQGGHTEAYQQALKVYMCLYWLSTALEDVEGSLATGNLAQRHAEDGLRCQHQLWRAAVDGIPTEDAWTYSM